MPSAYEKNRYLRLDGSPVEQGALRRTLAPKGIALSFLVAVGMTTDLTKLEDVGQLIPPIVYVGYGVLQRRFMNLATNAAWLMDFHRYAIDTKPSSRTQHNPPNSYHVTSNFSAAVTAITSLGCMINVGDYSEGTYLDRLGETLLPDIAAQFPTLQLAFQEAYAYRKVKTGQWKVIRIVDMEPEAQADKPQVCQPSLSAA
jgi:hypothetical protein